MPGRNFTTDAVVLLKRPPADTFQTLTVFSAEYGALLALQRISKKSASTLITLDLFDEATLLLESSNQGQTWFIKESRLLTRHDGIGRNYEALRHASGFTTLVARNNVPEESRPKVYALIRQVLTAFATSPRPDIAYFKGLYCFARDEGYPVKQEWIPSLSTPDRETVASLLNLPMAEQTAAATSVSRLQRRLEDYLRGHTEILLD